LSFFSAVLGWSRYRTVSFSCSERFGALAVGLAASFEALGGVPARVLFDNPKTVATAHLAGAAVLNPELVRLAAHYRFSPWLLRKGGVLSGGFKTIWACPRTSLSVIVSRCC
ncbi:MAG: hypothetical protein ACR2ML_07630, partial [Solirubrobacteraceae bacterium]